MRAEVVGLNQAKVTEFDIGGDRVAVLTAPRGRRLDVSKDYDTRWLRGESLFTSVVVFGSAFERRGMVGSSVPEQERWSAVNLPPGGIIVNEFSSNPAVAKEIGEAADNIELLVNEPAGAPLFLDPEFVFAYRRQDTRIAAHQWPAELNRSKWVPVSIVRAGITANEDIGFPLSEQVLIREKRLNGHDPKKLAVGVDYSEEDFERMRGAQLVLRDVAHATLASLTSVDLVLASYGGVPTESLWIGTVGTQPGYGFALEHRQMMQDRFGKETRIIAGRLSHEMSGEPHPYYIMRGEKQSAGDAGDSVDLLLPPEHRLVWPGYLRSEHLQRLAAIDMWLVQGLEVGQELTPEIALRLRHMAVNLGQDRFAIGRALTGLIE